MRSRGRRLGAVASLCLLWVLAATQAAVGMGLEDWQRRAAAIAEQAPAALEAYRDMAAEVARRHRRQVEQDLAQELPAEPQPGERLLVFVTLGPEPERDLERNRRLLREVAAWGEPEVVVALRGLPAGMRTLKQLAAYFQQLRGDGALPGLRLDPTLFRRHRVQVAPTVVLERDGQKVAEVRGLVSPQWLRRQAAAGRRGDLGQMGPTSPLAERDLIEELQERLLAVDWEAKKRRALERYWERLKFVALPRAQEERQYYVAAKYRVPQEVVLPGGKVLARAGEELDLCQQVRPTFALVVFDAADPAQVAWAKGALRAQQGRWRVKLLATALPERSWLALEKLEAEFQAPVYLLSEEVRERFRLERVPALVVPEAGRFLVREVNLAAETAPQTKVVTKGEANATGY